MFGVFADPTHLLVYTSEKFHTNIVKIPVTGGCDELVRRALVGQDFADSYDTDKADESRDSAAKP